MKNEYYVSYQLPRVWDWRTGSRSSTVAYFRIVDSKWPGNHIRADVADIKEGTAKSNIEVTWSHQQGPTGETTFAAGATRDEATQAALDAMQEKVENWIEKWYQERSGQ